MAVREPKAEDIIRFGGVVHACRLHSEWDADCNACGYSFPDYESMKAYHDFCNFGPTVYDIVPAKKGSQEEAWAKAADSKSEPQT